MQMRLPQVKFFTHYFLKSALKLILILPETFMLPSVQTAEALSTAMYGARPFRLPPNLSNMTFVNTWTGAVDKEIEEHINQHSVICNNSNVKFNFLSTFGVESDFNEFSEGIISDIIFSQID